MMCLCVCMYAIGLKYIFLSFFNIIILINNMTGSTAWTRFLKKNGGEGKSRTQLLREYKKTPAYKKSQCKKQGKVIDKDTKKCRKKKTTRKKKKTTRKKKKTTRKKKKTISVSAQDACNFVAGKSFAKGKCKKDKDADDEDEYIMFINDNPTDDEDEEKHECDCVKSKKRNKGNGRVVDQGTLERMFRELSLDLEE